MSAPAVLALVAGFVGLGVLIALGFALFGQIRSLGRTVAAQSARLAEVGSPPPVKVPGESVDETSANTG